MPTKPKPKSCRLFSNIPHRTISSARPDMPQLRIFLIKQLQTTRVLTSLRNTMINSCRQRFPEQRLTKHLKNSVRLIPIRPKPLICMLQHLRIRRLSLTTLRNTTGMRTRIRLLSIPIMLRCLCPELQQWSTPFRTGLSRLLQSLWLYPQLW